jgi:hypothetical protein
VHAALNNPKEGLLGVRAKYRRVPGSDTGGGAGLSRARLGHRRSGMTGGPHLSSAAGEEGGGVGWRQRCGPAGPR